MIIAYFKKPEPQQRSFSDPFPLLPRITLLRLLRSILLHWPCFQGQAFKIWTFNTTVFFVKKYTLDSS